MHKGYYVDLLLLSCPSKVIDYPCLSLPALTGFLKQNNIEVLQKDLNIEIKDAILKAENLEYIYKTILPLLIRLNINHKDNYSKLKQFYNLLKNAKSVFGFEKIEETVKLCQKREYMFLKDKLYLDCLNIIFDISKSCDFFFSFIYMYFPIMKENNISFFLIDYLESEIREIVALKPRMIGLSMITTQNNFSLWFSHYLRSYGNYKGFILIGGSQPTKFEQQYLEDNSYIDFVISGEGEYPLLQLTEELRKEKPQLDQIPRLIYRSEGKVTINKNVKYLTECYKNTFPYYEGFSLEKYLSPALPLLASSNCLWKKCKFCAHRTSFKEEYKERSPENVVDEMEHMFRKYGTRLFHFADEAISAEHGARIGKIIEQRGLPFYWMSFGRLDEEFNENNLNAWYKGGARVVEWGLETASDEILTKMNKGITVRKAQEILQIAGRLGIKNKLLTWHNYPGETLEDLQKTINFVSKNVREGFAAPMLTLKQKLVLQVGSELYYETFFEQHEEKLFEKVWLPASNYSINASYFNSKDYAQEKQAMILPYIKEMKDYCEINDIFIATNENVSFDLILYQLKEG